MFNTLIQVYFWIALFTAASIWFEWTFTGSKSDYRYLRHRLRVLFGDEPGKHICAFFFVWFLGSVLWWVTYYQRIRDVINEVRSKQ